MEKNPSSGADFVHATFSHKGRREKEVVKPGDDRLVCCANLLFPAKGGAR
jgi:hypothetical protein